MWIEEKGREKERKGRPGYLQNTRNSPGLEVQSKSCRMHHRSDTQVQILRAQENTICFYDITPLSNHTVEPTEQISRLPKLEYYLNLFTRGQYCASCE